MPVFAYKGIATGSGKPTSGVREAENQRALKAALKREGIYITDASEARHQVDVSGAATVGILALLNPVSALKLLNQEKNANNQQVAILTRQLGVLLKAGVPLSEGLGALTEQFNEPYLKRILSDVKQQVNEGSSFADALSRHPRSFEELYINMVRAGEASGALEKVLFRLAEFIEAQNDLKNKLSSAMVYPIAMSVIGAVVIGILMTTVVPKVTSMFTDMGGSLPWNTRLLIAVSDLLGGSWLTIVWPIPNLLILLPLMALVTMVTLRWLATPVGTAWKDKTLLRLWVVGPLVRMVAVSRFAKTLATMLSSGVPLLRALDIVKNILGNTVLTKVVEDARNSIKEGESIAAPLKRSGQFPPIVTHMIAVGERTGELESMLENVADSYKVEVDMKIERMTSLLAPLMIVTMGASVAFIVFSILMPIMQMNEFVS